MPTHEELHKLIDELPVESIHGASRVVSYVQAPSIHGDMRQLLLQLKPLMNSGVAPEFGGSSHYDSDKDSGAFSSNYWDGDS